MTIKPVLLLICLAAADSVQAQSAMWIDVPFVSQPADGCGAASISMVMEYWARQQGRGSEAGSQVAAIQHALYSRKLHGIAASSMASYFQQYAFTAFAFNGNWQDLEEQLQKGRPLIVALKPSGQAQLHYVVIDGIDPEHSLVIINDPADRKLLRQEREEFERQWSFSHNWMLLAVPASSR